MNNPELITLHDRMRNIVLNTCNTVGCKDCDLRWNDEHGRKISCSAIELQHQIDDIETAEFK